MMESANAGTLGRRFAIFQQKELVPRVAAHQSKLFGAAQGFNKLERLVAKPKRNILVVAL